MAEASLGTLGKLLGNPVGEAAAFAAGLAVGPLLRPVLQEEENLAWSAYQSKPLDPESAAELLARGHVDAGTAGAEASLSGISADRFKQLSLLAEIFPGLATALELQRRGELPEGELATLLNRLGFNADYVPRLASLVDGRLDPAIIANAIQRGIMPAPFTLPYQPEIPAGKVPAFPTSPLDPTLEAQAAGINVERLFVETALIGRPASPDLAARMAFRGIIDGNDFTRAIAEGDTRNEWAPFLFDGFREIPTAHDYVDLRLRGWITDAQMYAGTALHGMSQEDTDRLFLVGGRPMSAHAVFIAMRRGGTYNGPTDMISPPFLKSLEESNIRPEWYNLEWFGRESYPSAFVVKALATGGDLTSEQTTEILMNIGWPEWLIPIVVAKWVPAVATTATHAKSAVTTAITTLRKAYIAGQSNVAQATQFLTQLGVAAGEITSLLSTWDVQKQIEALHPVAAA